jgi:hypothetical protein
MKYQLFCSYSHVDNEDGWVDRCADVFLSTYRKLTGVEAKFFVDRESLITSEVWNRKISAALKQSQMMVAVLSPSYVRSEWCRREWHTFVDQEDELRRKKLLTPEQGLIFPILLYPFERGRFDAAQRAFKERIIKRQYLDFSSQIESTPIRSIQVRQIVENIIDLLAEDTRRRRISESTKATSSALIFDQSNGLVWSGSISKFEMSFTEAKQYVKNLEIEGIRGWRLPTRDELESILDPALLSDDPYDNLFPVREPFNAQRYGFLHSGTLLFPKAKGVRKLDNYIMNIRNGHIFNGGGHEGDDCYVRAVRSSRDIGRPRPELDRPSQPTKAPRKRQKRKMPL